MKITTATERVLLLTAEKDRLTVTKICKELNLTYSHGSKTIKILTARKLLSTIKAGRCRYCMITDKGLRLCKNLLKTQEIIEGD